MLRKLRLSNINLNSVKKGFNFKNFAAKKETVCVVDNPYTLEVRIIY